MSLVSNMSEFRDTVYKQEQIWTRVMLFVDGLFYVCVVPVQTLKLQLVQRVQSVQSECQSTNEDDSATSHKLHRARSEDVATRVRLAQLTLSDFFRRYGKRFFH